MALEVVLLISLAARWTLYKYEMLSLSHLVTLPVCEYFPGADYRHTPDGPTREAVIVVIELQQKKAIGVMS